jgi:hypothetical protein
MVRWVLVGRALATDCKENVEPLAVIGTDSAECDLSIFRGSSRHRSTSLVVVA